VLDPSVVEQLLNRADQAGAQAAHLTSRQRAVLTLMAEGRSNAAIAERLFISEKTVINHITSIYTTLGLELDEGSHRRVQSVLAYLAYR
jgi:DNA-binding NarL/FixJ family response regulator